MLTHNVCLRHRRIFHSLIPWCKMCIVKLPTLRGVASLVICMDVGFKYIVGNGEKEVSFFLDDFHRVLLLLSFDTNTGSV